HPHLSAARRVLRPALLRRDRRGWRAQRPDDRGLHGARAPAGDGGAGAADLAQAGLRVPVLERRPILGGACVTEEVWPGARVSRASYVVSMLQPQVVSDLRLREFGYRAVPLDPAYAALTTDGPIFFHNDPKLTAASV